jgi:chaperonin cofactor prefoldin
MPAIFRNRVFKYALYAIGGLLAAAIAFWFLANMQSNSTGFSSESFDAGMVPAASRDFGRVINELSPSIPQPNPATGGAVSQLEAYETTRYDVRARTRAFDELCAALTVLKDRSEINFRQLNTSTNSCTATFYVPDSEAAAVAETLRGYSGVEIARTTNSVTRHRSQLQSQASIVRQQLASVERSLAVAETEFDEIAVFARDSNDAATLATAIREKLSLIDTLTQRKITLTSQLDRLLQQSADLEERLGVAEFQVNASRLFPIYANERAQQWQGAWDELSNTFTDTLIVLSATFGIFLLWLIRVVVYGAVVIVVVRLLWKFVRLIWRKV